MQGARWIAFGCLLTACSSTPPPPDWKLNAVSQIEHAQTQWLEGDSKSADLALSKARAEIARSGRVDLVARAQLAVCATHVASLDFSPCDGYQRVAVDAAAPEVAYSRFLAGDWAGLDARLLPAHYAALVGSKDDTAADRAVADITQPLPRLIAAGVLFRQTRSQPATFALAVDTASQQGWRRPLLAWLEVERQRALAAGDQDAAARAARRIELARTPQTATAAEPR